MINTIRLSLVAFCALGQMPSASSATPCVAAITVNRAAVNVIQADANKTARTLDPSFFGFNLEWLEFQRGFWDPASKSVLPEVVSLFKNFPGAVYRFPGGTNANHIDWRDAVGPVNTRPANKYVTWLGPLKAEFGLDEYLKFVKDVNGQAWYVANLYGTLADTSPLPELATNAQHLSEYVTTRTVAGFPRILRWELGNELDRGALQWSPQYLANAASQVAAGISRGNSNAKFVHLQQEYPAQSAKGYTASKYNKELRAGLVALQPEYALHFYYDGVPDTLPVDYFLKQLCQVVDSAKAEGSPGNIWITEHARVPNGFWVKTPRELWPETANLTASISMADMLIALSQVPEARGAFAHSLVSTDSPWPLVNKRKNGAIDPSVTLLGMTLLRQSMLPNVLSATQTSNESGWQGAQYSVRSAVMANDERTAFALWSINKSNSAQTLQFRLTNAPLSLAVSNTASVADEQANANNSFSPTRVQIQTKAITVTSVGLGLWNIQLPANSVNALHFN